MTKRDYLGNFELMVMLALIRLGGNANGVPICRELEERGGREVAVGSVYAALERLEDKGFVASELGDATPERGGRAESEHNILMERGRFLINISDGCGWFRSYLLLP
jgi:PadR family transcriptional regulator, regulatory protein PadR